MTSKADDDFLKIFYEIQYRRLEAHSKIEYRLLNMFIVIFPTTITASIAISQIIKDNGLYLTLVSFVSLFLLILTKAISIKVHSEHKTYKSIAKSMIKIWEYFQLTKNGAYLSNKTIQGEDYKKFGDGTGYKDSLLILWAITFVVIAVLIGFGAIRFII